MATLLSSPSIRRRSSARQEHRRRFSAWRPANCAAQSRRQWTGQNNFFSGPSSLFPTMPRAPHPRSSCRARNGCPGPRWQPRFPQPSVAELKLDWTTPPLIFWPPPGLDDAILDNVIEEASPATQLCIQQAAAGPTETGLSFPGCTPCGSLRCARCGLAFPSEELKRRNNDSWLCHFHYAVADVEAELSNLGIFDAKRSSITNVIKFARDICIMPTG